MTKRKSRTHIDAVPVGDRCVGGGYPLMVIAGPCVVEDVGLCVEIANEIKVVTQRLGLSYVFKASYDKANKTIAGSYRGPGQARGIAALAKVKADTGVLITTDVHEISQCSQVAEVADILQIPALLSKQIDLIKAAAATGKVINIKKGQFTAPWEMRNVLSRLSEEGYKNIIQTDRGYMFGYNTLVSDMRALQIMSNVGKPVIYDVSHSVHGNETILTGSSFKHRDFIAPLARSAVANGVDGLFMEVHPDPDNALSDSAGTLDLADVEQLLRTSVAIDDAVERN